MSEETVRYVERTKEGGWRIAGTRVSLDSVVLAYHEGWTPERIASSFPSVTLEQIHGALAYYLHNQEQVDRLLASQAATWNDLRSTSERDNAGLLEKLRSQRKPGEAVA